MSSEATLVASYTLLLKKLLKEPPLRCDMSPTSPSFGPLSVPANIRCSNMFRPGIGHMSNILHIADNPLPDNRDS